MHTSVNVHTLPQLHAHKHTDAHKHPYRMYTRAPHTQKPENLYAAVENINRPSFKEEERKDIGHAAVAYTR